jgi:hypothetical protein
MFLKVRRQRGSQQQAQAATCIRHGQGVKVGHTSLPSLQLRRGERIKEV